MKTSFSRGKEIKPRCVKETVSVVTLEWWGWGVAETSVLRALRHRGVLPEPGEEDENPHLPAMGQSSSTVSLGWVRLSDSSGALKGKEVTNTLNLNHCLWGINNKKWKELHLNTQSAKKKKSKSGHVPANTNSKVKHSLLLFLVETIRQLPRKWAYFCDWNTLDFINKRLTTYTFIVISILPTKPSATLNHSISQLWQQHRLLSQLPHNHFRMYSLCFQAVNEL